MRQGQGMARIAGRPVRPEDQVEYLCAGIWHPVTVVQSAPAWNGVHMITIRWGSREFPLNSGSARLRWPQGSNSGSVVPPPPTLGIRP